jgi:hypothetical protein
MTLKHLMDVDLNKITPEDYIRLSHLEWSDYVYSKTHVLMPPFRRGATAISSLPSLFAVLSVS